jgi:uncharacterized phage infection (PIP) family protein YhgE
MVSCVNILFGFAWNPTPHTLEKVKIAVVNADVGLLGEILPTIISKANSFGFNYNFLILDKSNSFTDLMSDVDRGIYTAALHLNAGSSDYLMSAISNKTTIGYDNKQVFSYVWDEGRAGPSYQFAFGTIGSSIASIMNTYAKIGISQQYSALGKNTSDINLKTFNQPVGVFITNLHPVEKNGVQLAVGSGMMQVSLVALIMAGALLKIHTDLEGRGINKFHLSYLRITHRIVGSLVLSIWPPLTLLILGGLETLDASQFFAWWMLLWIGMVVFGSVAHYTIEIFGFVLGFLIIIILLLLQVASSTAAVPFAAMPDFYLIGMYSVENNQDCDMNKTVPRSLKIKKTHIHIGKHTFIYIHTYTHTSHIFFGLSTMNIVRAEMITLSLLSSLILLLLLLLSLLSSLT